MLVNCSICRPCSDTIYSAFSTRRRNLAYPGLPLPQHLSVHDASTDSKTVRLPSPSGVNAQYPAPARSVTKAGHCMEAVLPQLQVLLPLLPKSCVARSVSRPRSCEDHKIAVALCIKSSELSNTCAIACIQSIHASNLAPCQVSRC